MSFQNTDLQMQITCQHWSTATLWPLCPSAANLCAHTPTRTHISAPSQQRPASRPWEAAPRNPSLSSPADPLSDGPLFTFTLLHGPAGPGGPAESLHYCLVLPCNPLPSRPSLTPFTVLKSTICITQQSGSEREGEMGQEGERKQGGEKGHDGRGGRGGKGEKGSENERHLNGCWAVCQESICQIVFTVWRLPCWFAFFKHCAYWFFYCLLLYLPSISTFQNLLILHVFSSLKVFSNYSISLFPWPASLLSSLLSPSFPPPPSSEYILHHAVVLHKHSRASCMAACVKKADFSHGAAGENWDSLCPSRDAICPCRRTC